MAHLGCAVTHRAVASQLLGGVRRRSFLARSAMAGTALVCAESVLDPRRNPSLDRAAAEAVLRDHLGVETVIWLARGLVDDASGGHVDNLACFARPGVVLLTWSARCQGARARGDRDPAAGAASPRGRPKAH